MKEYVYSQKNMGTTVTVSVVTPTEELAQKISDICFADITSYEKKFSRFLADSELSKLNQVREMVVTNDFYEVLERSYELYKITNGAFNPLVQIASYGYTVDYKSLPRYQDITTQPIPPDSINFDLVGREKKSKCVTLAPGQKLDFGGILKGYLANKLAVSVSAEYPDCTGIIINLGGDIHTRGYDEKGNPFVFYIFNPVTDEEMPVTLTNTSLATSGVYARTWQTASGTAHHILTGLGTLDPNMQGVSASIIHNDGATAEAFTKLLLQHGPRAVITAAGDETCRYLLISSDGSVKTNIV